MQVKANWLNEGSSWTPMDALRLHEPYVLIDYVVKNQLISMHLVKHVLDEGQADGDGREGRFCRQLRQNLRAPAERPCHRTLFWICQYREN